MRAGPGRGPAGVRCRLAGHGPGAGLAAARDRRAGQERVAQAQPGAGEIVLAARWNAYEGDGGWYVRGGENEFVPMPDERTANRTARQFNRIEKRAEKRGDGFMPADTGPCADPLSQVQC